MTSFLRALIPLFTCIAIVGCGGSDAEALDSVEITEVTPASAAIDANTTFTVTFRYTLSTSSSGIIDLGFFRDATNQLLTGQNLIVTKGSGTGTLTATANPSQYTTGPEFAAGILLSQHPHDATWTPLARAKQHLPVTP
jgi:hypothetical protein